MIILGLQFGHDASVTVLKDGEVLLCYEVERTSRIKHVMGLGIEDIELALEDVGLQIQDVDYASITSTQLIEYIIMDESQLDIKLEILPEHNLPCTMIDKLKIYPEKMSEYSSGWLDYLFKNNNPHSLAKHVKHLKDKYEKSDGMRGSYEHFVWCDVWEKRLKLKEISEINFNKFFTSDEVSQGFHYPFCLQLKGKKIPAYIFAHHYAHAAYSYFSSPFEDAAIISHDGGGGGLGYGGGMFYYGRKNRLFPISPHNLYIGQVYDETGLKVGFDLAGASGKLMGLSAYGKARFFSFEDVGNWYDVDQLGPEKWAQKCVELARRMNYDLSNLGSKEKILDPINVDLASSAQKLVEEIMLY